MDHRLCLSCRFFSPNFSGAAGRCLHPDRQTPGIPILIRPAELRCRRGFDSDDWAPARVPASPAAEDIVLSERPAPVRPRQLPILLPGLADSEDHAPTD